MKTFLTIALLASAAVFTPAHADQTTPAPIIGVVAQATLDQSAALQSIVKQVEAKRADIQKELAKYEKDLKEQDKKLAEEQKTLSEKDFADKRQAFEKKVRDIQEKIELKRIQMELGVDEAKKKVYQAFLKASDEVSKEAGVNVMLYKETIVTADPTFDLSSKVLEKLNKALPTVQVSFKSEDEIKKLIKKQAQPQQAAAKS